MRPATFESRTSPSRRSSSPPTRSSASREHPSAAVISGPTPRWSRPRPGGRWVMRRSVVEEVGAEVRNVKVGDLVVMPFAFSDGTCAFCHEGLHTACVHGGFFDGYGTSAAQAEAVPVLLTLTTLMGTPAAAADAASPAP